MSFILDALKKLEQKRRHGTVPDLTTVHDINANSRKRFPLWPYLFLAAILLNTVILAIFMIPAKKEITQASAPTKDISSDSQPVSETEKVISEDSSAEAETKPADISSLPLAGSEKQNMIQTETVVQDTAEEVHGINLSPAELDSLRKKITEEQKGYTETDALNTPLLPADEVKNNMHSIPFFDQLPSSVRENIPEISIKGHIYSNDPLSRIVNVNGNILREGDNVTKDLKIEEVTVSGIIFNFSGLRFSMRAF